jgi:hypothetical protein
MVEFSIEGYELAVAVRGWSRLWALKSQLRLPLSHVRAVRWDPSVARGWWKGWRLPGTHIPGVIVAGTYYRDGAREFWDVRGGGNAVVVELERDPYARIVVEVADPPVALAMIERALGRAHGAQRQ